MEGTWHAVARFDELRQGEVREAYPGGEPVIVVRLGHEVLAAAAICPHKFGLLAEGSLEGRRLTCPVHAASFDLVTGLPGAGQEWAGRLPLFPVRVRDGLVEVQVGS